MGDYTLRGPSPEDFKTALGYQPQLMQKEQGKRPLCPGQFFRHYAPQARLILGNSELVPYSSFILGFKERSYAKGKHVIFLGSLSDPQEVAENLYRALRQLDQEGADQAWVDMNFPRTGLWQTIAERLTRASEGYFSQSIEFI